MKHPFAYYQASDATGGGTSGGDGTATTADPGTSGAAGNDAQNPQGSTNEATEVKDLPEWAQTHIRELRRENADHRTKAKAAEEAARKASEEKAKQDGEWQKLAEQYKAELDTKNAEIAKRDRADLARKVAAKYKLPDTLAARLQGDTEEAMEADAKELVKALPTATAPNMEAGDRSAKKPPIDKDETFTFAKPGDLKRTLKRA